MENGTFIDGLPIKNGDFPWQTVSHNQMVKWNHQRLEPCGPCNFILPVSLSEVSPWLQWRALALLLESAKRVRHVKAVDSANMLVSRVFCFSITHRIHVWYIYIYASMWGILMVNVTIYIYSIHGSCV